MSAPNISPLQVLGNPSAEAADVWLRDCRQSFSIMIREKQTRDAAAAKKEVSSSPLVMPAFTVSLAEFLLQNGCSCAGTCLQLEPSWCQHALSPAGRKNLPNNAPGVHCMSLSPEATDLVFRSFSSRGRLVVFLGLPHRLEAAF